MNLENSLSIEVLLNEYLTRQALRQVRAPIIGLYPVKQFDYDTGEHVVIGHMPLASFSGSALAMITDVLYPAIMKFNDKVMRENVKQAMKNIPDASNPETAQVQEQEPEKNIEQGLSSELLSLVNRIKTLAEILQDLIKEGGLPVREYVLQSVIKGCGKIGESKGVVSGVTQWIDNLDPLELMGLFVIILDSTWGLLPESTINIAKKLLGQLGKA
jgi:hypothetical protein